jgi:hypothetical protein
VIIVVFCLVVAILSLVGYCWLNYVDHEIQNSTERKRLRDIVNELEQRTRHDD